MPLTDTHCHLDAHPDPDAAAAAAGAAGVSVWAMTGLPRDVAEHQALAARHPHVRVGLGFHPLEIPKISALDAELALFDRLLPGRRLIGEIGLDGQDTDPAVQAAQQRVFRHILERCGGDHVLSIHSRRAAGPVLDAIAGHPSRRILHWFSGTPEELRRGLEAGCFFSVNPAMRHSERGKALVRLLPPERVLLETDAPFARHHGRPCGSADLHHLVRDLAALWGKEQDGVEAVIAENVRRISGCENEPRP